MAEGFPKMDRLFIRRSCKDWSKKEKSKRFKRCRGRFTTQHCIFPAFIRHICSSVVAGLFAINSDAYQPAFVMLQRTGLERKNGTRSEAASANFLSNESAKLKIPQDRPNNRSLRGWMMRSDSKASTGGSVSSAGSSAARLLKRQ